MRGQSLHIQLSSQRAHPFPMLSPALVSNTKHGFLGFTSFSFKKNSKNFVVLGQQWKKNINAQINLGTKKQGITPQTIHILIYKNAIANGLRTI